MSKSLVQKNFDAAAADYVASTGHAKGPSLVRVVELVAPQSPWRTLDTATGGGHTAVGFAPHLLRVVASDITAEMLQEAEKVAARRVSPMLKRSTSTLAHCPFRKRAWT